MSSTDTIYEILCKSIIETGKIKEKKKSDSKRSHGERKSTKYAALSQCMTSFFPSTTWNANKTNDIYL